MPLVVKDFTGNFNLVPGERSQLTSSVDIAPLLLTIASGSGDWRASPDYAHIADRPDLLAIAQDPTKPGRECALHATDEVADRVRAAAVRRRRAAARRRDHHALAQVRHLQPLARPARWSRSPGRRRPSSTTTRPRAGVLEVDNLAGRSGSEETLRAIARPGHAPASCARRCPAASADVQEHALRRVPRPRPHRADAQLAAAPAQGRAGRRGHRARACRRRRALAPPALSRRGAIGARGRERLAGRVERRDGDHRRARVHGRLGLEPGARRPSRPSLSEPAEAPARIFHELTAVAPFQLASTVTVPPRRRPARRRDGFVIGWPLHGVEVGAEVLHARAERGVEQHAARVVVLGEVRQAAVAHQPVAVGEVQQVALARRRAASSSGS